MDEVDNPYRPSAGAQPPELAGRSELLHAFEITLARAAAGRPTKSLIPIGLRGVGKTALLNRWASQAEGLDASVAYVEAPENGEFLRDFVASARQILLQLDRKHRASQAIRRALGVFASFTVTLPDGSSLSFGVEPELGSADSGHLPRDLTEVLVAVGRAAAHHKTALLFAVDEMQLIPQAHLSALIQALHRTTQLDLPIVLTGTGLPQLPGLLGEAKTYAERLFTFPEIGSLGFEATRRAIDAPASVRDVRWEADALRAVYDRTKGYPFFIQEWAHDAWNHGVNNVVTVDDVAAVHGVVQTRLDQNFFRVRFDRLTEAERRYLRAMSSIGETAQAGEVAAALGKRVEGVSKTKDALIRKGMLYPLEHGVAAFTVPLFDQFMRRAGAANPRRATRSR